MGYNPGDEIKLEEEIVSLIASSIKADTSLTDSSIISILSKIELDKKILNDVTDPNK